MLVAVWQPHIVPIVLNQIKDGVRADTVIVSIAAGVPTEFLEDVRGGLCVAVLCAYSLLTRCVARVCYVRMRAAAQLLIDGEGAREPRVVRVMPNTPCLVGHTAAALCTGRWAQAADAELVQTIMSAVGTVVTVPEPLMDGVCVSVSVSVSVSWSVSVSVRAS